MAHGADPDQLASQWEVHGLDVHCLQIQDISRFSKIRVKNLMTRCRDNNDSTYQPGLLKGISVKINSNQRYDTT